MPFEIEWEPRGLRTRFHGLVSGADILRHSTAIDNDPRFDSLRYVIADFLEADLHSISETDVMLVSANDYGAAHTNPNIRVAIVTTDERVRSLARLYAAPPLEPYPTEVFRSVVEARDWIERQPPLDRPKKRSALHTGSA